MFSADGTWFANKERLAAFLQSPAACAIAAEAGRLGVADVRVDAVLPKIVLVVDGHDRPEIATLAAFAQVAVGATVEVKPLAAYPAWRRRTAWEVAPRLPGFEDDAP